MSELNWQHIEEIFSEALEIPSKDREQFVRARCGDNEKLCKEILEMLAADENSVDLIEESVVPPESLANLFAEKLFSNPPSLALSGRTIGDYKIIKKLGGGGMGAVYLGERNLSESARKVAIKLIKRGLDSNFNLRRFRHEQKILEAFDHPNITKFLDAGVTDDGLPFLVMEYVAGVSLFDYARQKRLDVKAKLELFRVVLGAVEYAHYHKVIHRDIKPSNILVTGAGTLKLLDFGIAKILDAELINESLSPTATMFQPLTPDYASPEQVKGDKLTTSSDIYSLGILLFELILDKRPYKITKSSPYEVIRAVCEQMPPVPSEVYKKSFPEARNIQDFYEADEEFFAEFDKVLLKSLQKNEKNRYASVIEFDEDIERLLSGKKVRAESFFVNYPNDKAFISSPSSTDSLAILPFEFLNPVKPQSGEKSGSEFLGIGLADILTTRLSNLQQFAVRPTSSVLRLVSKGLEAEEIGKQLKVDYLLEGHILLIENQYRVNVKLSSIADHRVLWAAKFDEAESNLFHLQDLIAEKVLDSLVPQITERDAAATEKLDKQANINDQAFEAFLRGRFYWHSYTVEGILESEKHFQRSIELDPNFSLAYSGLADYYNWLGVSGIDFPENIFPLAKKNALQALRLDRTSPEAFASLAFAVWAYDWDIVEAENLYRRAFELNPNYARAHEWYAYLLSSENRHDEAIERISRAEKLDPNSPSLTAMAGFLLYNARHYEESYAKTVKALEMQPDYYLALQGLGWICPKLGKFEEAVTGCRKAIEISNLLAMNEWSLALALAESGNLQESRKIALGIEKRMSAEHIPPYYLAVIYTIFGEFETAFKWLEKAIDERGYWTRWMRCKPRLDSLRKDARFAEFAQKLQPISVNQTQGNLFPDTKQIRVAAKNFDVPLKEPITRRAAAGILLAIIVFAFSLYQFAGKVETNEAAETVTSSAVKSANTLVILPFANDQGTRNTLGTGLADELKNNLGRFKKLSVLSVGTADKSALTDVKMIGSELEADFLLRGNFQDTGSAIQLSAELINTKNDEIIWRETFAAAKNEIFSLRGQIAERVLNVLAIELSGSEREYIARPYTKDSEAFQLYNAGRYHLAERKIESFEKAVANFTDAIKRDPKFALAYAGLADAYMLKNNHSPDQTGKLTEKAETAVMKALEIDENLAEAHTSLAFIKAKKKDETHLAEKHYRRAIELNPSYSTAYHWLATLYMTQHRYEEALEAIENAARIEPRSPIIQTARGTVYGKLNRFDEAFSHFNKAIEMDRGFAPAYINKSFFQQSVGDYQGALQTFTSARIFNTFPETDLRAKFMDIQNAAAQNRREAALAELEIILKDAAFRRKSSRFAVEIALVYNLLEDYEKTFEWLDKIEISELQESVATDPRFKNLQQDARFLRFVRNAASNS